MFFLTCPEYKYTIDKVRGKRGSFLFHSFWQSYLVPDSFFCSRRYKPMPDYFFGVNPLALEKSASGNVQSLYFIQSQIGSRNEEKDNGVRINQAVTCRKL